MKISGTKKLLIICLSLMLTLTVALFATLYLNRSASALVSPDGLSAYDVPDDSQQVDPLPPDPDTEEPEWVITIQQVVLEFGKLEIRVDQWIEGGIDTKAKFNSNPDGIYDSRPDLVEKIDELISSTDFIVYTALDVDGNPVDPDTLGAGVTVFIHVNVKEGYSDNVKLTFKDGVPSSYSYSTDFPSGTKLNKVPVISKTTFEFEYDGTELDFQKLVLDEILKNRDTYLMFVASESDALVQNGAGEFRLKICFKNGAQYCWDSGITNDRTAVEIVIKVTPKTVTLTADLGELSYTGYDIDIKSKLEEIYGDYVIVAAGYDESTVGKTVGEYTFHIMLNPKYGDSIKWADGVEWADGIEGHVAITWHIKPLTISGDWGPAGDLGRITITGENDFKVQAGDIEYVYTNKATGNVVDLTVDKLVVGETYEVEVILKNTNLVWDETTETTHIFTLTKEIKVFPKPEMGSTEKEFTGTELSFVVTIDGKPITDPEFADYIEIVADLSDSLTQTNAGKYKIVIRLKDEAASWPGNETGDIVIEFFVTAIELDVEWNDPDTGAPTFVSSYLGTDYSKIVKIVYKNAAGETVTRAQMVKGETYTVVLELIDGTNFKWKEGAVLEYQFTLNIEMVTLTVPTVKESTYSYTGAAIEVQLNNLTLLNEYISKGYIEIIEGSLQVTNAGTHTIVLRIKDTSCIWDGTTEETITLTFTVNRAVLTGEWQNNGKVKFTSSFTGDYDTVVEYVYTDADGNEVAYADLVEGQTYTATVRLKMGMEGNFDASQLPAPYTFTFSMDDGDGSSFPWWIFLIIGLVLLIIIIIIIIIIILKKRKKKDDEYDDFYGDEYYGDEEGSGEGEGGDAGDYDYSSSDF